MIFSKDIDDQRILQSDWTRGTIGHTQPKEVVLHAPDLHAKNLRDWWITSRDTDDQKKSSIWLDKRWKSILLMYSLSENELFVTKKYGPGKNFTYLTECIWTYCRI